MESLGTLGDEGFLKELIPSIGKRAIFMAKLKVFTEASIVAKLVPIIEVQDKSADSVGLDNIENNSESSSVSYLELETIMVDNGDETMGGAQVSHIFTIEEVGHAFTKSNKTKLKPITMASSSKGRVPYPSQIPDLSPFLDMQFKNRNLKKYSLQFIKECAHFLSMLTDNQPKPKDYENFSLTVVEKYPEFKDHSTLKPNGTLKLRLSHFLRNERATAKNAEKLSTPGPRKSKSYDLATVNGESSHSDVSAEDHAAIEAQLKTHGKTGNTHSQMLVKKTLKSRRDFVKLADTVTIIVDKYPHLENYKMFMYDFHLIDGIKEPKIVRVEINNMIKLLRTLEGVDELDTLTELDTLSIFARLERKLHPKGLKGFRRCLSIEEAGNGPMNIEVNSLQAPSVIGYYQDNELVDCLLVAEGKVVCNKHDATAEDAVLLLLSSYFVLHRSYPIACESFLTFLTMEILHINENPHYRGSITFNKLVKSYNGLKSGVVQPSPPDVA